MQSWLQTGDLVLAAIARDEADMGAETTAEGEQGRGRKRRLQIIMTEASLVQNI